MRYIGPLAEETEEGFLIKSKGQEVYYFYERKEPGGESVLVVNIPRTKHNEPRCVAAKEKELSDWKEFKVYEVVDEPADKKKVIGCEWVLVEKERKGQKVVKARLVARGDLEPGRETIL